MQAPPHTAQAEATSPELQEYEKNVSSAFLGAALRRNGMKARDMLDKWSGSADGVVNEDQFVHNVQRTISGMTDVEPEPPTHAQMPSLWRHVRVCMSEPA